LREIRLEEGTNQGRESAVRWDHDPGQNKVEVECSEGRG
jgi:hypothetical protein